MPQYRDRHSKSRAPQVAPADDSYRKRFEERAPSQPGDAPADPEYRDRFGDDAAPPREHEPETAAEADASAAGTTGKED